LATSFEGKLYTLNHLLNHAIFFNTDEPFSSKDCKGSASNCTYCHFFFNGMICASHAQSRKKLEEPFCSINHIYQATTYNCVSFLISDDRVETVTRQLWSQDLTLMI